MLSALAERVFGSANARYLKQLDGIVAEIKPLFQGGQASSVRQLITAFGQRVKFYLSGFLSADGVDANSFGLDYATAILGTFSAFANGLPPSYLATSMYRNNTTDFKLESFGIFAEAYIDLTDRLSFTGGIRYNDDSKTVAARKILSYVPDEERIVTIEEAAELLPAQPNAVTLIANRDAEFQSADVLLTATLRMRPDRIILGEVRGKEAMTFLEAINTGHGGSMTTLHAETPQLAVQRLAIAALKTEIPMTYQDMIQYIESSIDVIIQAGREDGERGITEFYLPGTELQERHNA